MCVCMCECAHSGDCKLEWEVMDSELEDLGSSPGGLCLKPGLSAV